MGDVVPIGKFKALNPSQVRDIVAAFDEACATLSKQPPSDMTRAILAKRITELVEGGELDRQKLKDLALEYLEALANRTAQANETEETRTPGPSN